MTEEQITELIEMYERKGKLEKWDNDLGIFSHSLKKKDEENRLQDAQITIEYSFTVNDAGSVKKYTEKFDIPLTRQIDFRLNEKNVPFLPVRYILYFLHKLRNSIMKEYNRIDAKLDEL